MATCAQMQRKIVIDWSPFYFRQAQGRHTILSMKRGIGDDLSNFESLWSGWAEVEINEPEEVLFVDEAEAMPRRGISSQLLQWTM